MVQHFNRQGEEVPFTWAEWFAQAGELLLGGLYLVGGAAFVIGFAYLTYLIVGR